MKRKIVPILLTTGVMVLTGCNNTPTLTSLTISNKDELSLLYVSDGLGKTISIESNPAIKVDDEVKAKNLTFKSSNEEVIKLSGRGILPPTVPGKATVTAYYYGKEYDHVDITVEAARPVVVRTLADVLANAKSGDEVSFGACYEGKTGAIVEYNKIKYYSYVFFADGESWIVCYQVPVSVVDGFTLGNTYKVSCTYQPYNALPESKAQTSTFEALTSTTIKRGVKPAIDADHEPDIKDLKSATLASLTNVPVVSTTKKEESGRITVTATIKPKTKEYKLVFDSKYETIDTANDFTKLKGGDVISCSSMVDVGQSQLSYGLDLKVTPAAYVDPTGVEINEKTIVLHVGQTINPQLTWTPSNAYTDHAWTSDATEVVKVNEDGTLTALKEGKANITVASTRAGCEDIKDTASVTVVLTDRAVPTLSEVVAGNSYVLGMYHGNLFKNLFMLPELDGYYGKTTPLIADAQMFKFEAVEESNGEFYISHTDSSSKTVYVSLVKSGTYINVKFLEDKTAASKWEIDSTTKAIKTALDGADYFLGTANGKTYNTVDKVEASKVSESSLVKVVDFDKVSKERIGIYITGETSVVAEAKITLSLNARPYYLGGIEASEALWATSDDKIATVDENGVVTGVAEGKATITATLNDKSGSVFTADYEISVTKAVEYEEKAAYNFSNFDSENPTASISDTNKAAILKAITEEKLTRGTNIVSDINGFKKVDVGYDYTPQGGEKTTYYENGWKFGTGSVDGTITFALTEPVKRVEVVGCGWSASDNKLTVTGCSKTQSFENAVYSKKVTDKLVFTLDEEATEITITFGHRGFVQEINFLAPKAE